MTCGIRLAVLAFIRRRKVLRVGPLLTRSSTVIRSRRFDTQFSLRNETVKLPLHIAAATSLAGFAPAETIFGLNEVLEPGSD
jgi:hypothetical protein